MSADEGRGVNAARPGAPVLAVDALAVSYGPIRALRGVSFAVERGETVAILGANGAGKTTLMKALCNLLPHAAGRVGYLGRDIAGRGPHELARAGLLHVPEGRGTLGRLSVRDNLRLAYDRDPAGGAAGGDEPFDAALERVYARFPRLAERIDQLAGSMSGGEQQMLALARAVVRRPLLLLVDEPSLGLAPLVVQQVFALLGEFRAERMTILLVEQNARAALRLADRAFVLRQGEFVASGRARDLLADPAILGHYLGG
jgi:branched-chain amino acid transport system ATP-binding protein